MELKFVGNFKSFKNTVSGTWKASSFSYELSVPRHEAFCTTKALQRASLRNGDFPIKAPEMKIRFRSLKQAAKIESESESNQSKSTPNQSKTIKINPKPIKINPKPIKINPKSIRIQ